MFQLAYISSSGRPIEPSQLTDILTVSRQNNARAGVTGLLVAGGRRFLQVLEGSEASVLATYARIQADPRHRAFVLLSCQAVPERAFGDWSMAFHIKGADFARPSLEASVAALVDKIADRNLRAQFTGFAKLHNRAA